MTTTNLPRVPLFVVLGNSESGAFNPGEIYPFADFETKARKVARDHGRGGYEKTHITVLFADGSTYEMRLDLAEDDEHGFEQAAGNRVHNWTQWDNARRDEYGKFWADMIAFLQGIEWPESRTKG